MYKLEDKNHPDNLANEYSTKGMVKHFLLTKGFMPGNDEEAIKIIDNIFKEWEENCDL